ncbi:hypothetical protein [Bradyrhizobium sp. 192]|uniref:hypothetical protein n=1 Tax=Bradyrhizobium sp. 192 TaxID=2782660 RepID=UPI001FFE8005|nr:hypothetical protein [Bradyrhizobium sp. 192]
MPLTASLKKLPSAPNLATVCVCISSLPDPERGEAKVAGVSDLQSEQPFEKLSSSIVTTKPVCCFVQDDQRGPKVFDVYRNDKRDIARSKHRLCRTRAFSAHKSRNGRKTVLKVSDEIKSAVQAQGYYIRSLRPPRSE